MCCSCLVIKHGQHFRDYKWIHGTKYREKDAFGRTALSNCTELKEVTACYSFIQTSRELYLFLLEKEALVTTHTHINITVHEGTRWNVRVCSSNKPANEMYLSAVIRKYPRSRFRRCLGLIMNQLCLVERQLQLVSVCVLLYIRSIRFAFCTWRVWERLLVFLIWLVLYFFKRSFLYLVTVAVTRHMDSHSAVFQGFHLWNCLETVYSFHWQTWVSLLIECNVT